MADFSRGSTVVVSPKLQQSYAHLPTNISHYTSLPSLPSLPTRTQEQKLPSLPITLPRLRIDSITGVALFNNTETAPPSRAAERSYASANHPSKLNGFSVKLNWNFQLAAPQTWDAQRPPVHHLTSRNPNANVYPVFTSQAFSMAGEGGTGPYAAPSSFEQLGDEAEAAHQVGSGAIVADNVSVTDAGYESDTAATTASTSVSSSIWDFSFENGRRYHKFREGRYNFPNDDDEQEREDMKHAMLKMLCQQLYFAPIGDNPHEILDLGTGTGVWAIEMGDTYPSANVLGLDLSPIQPQWVPPNVRFMVDDVESPWLHPKNHFDYIHSRHMIMAIKDWDKLLRTSYEHLKPGGWIELQEIHHFPASSNGTLASDHPVAQYWQYVDEGLINLGVSFRTSNEGRIAAAMRECGYVNVTERVFHIPIGTWPKNKTLKSVGLYWKTILLDGIQAIALGPMTRGLHWRREQVEALLVSVRKGYHDNSLLLYMPLVCVYGQKPESQ
ncbi:S-adenosyl-L-methionine-dependent methyltransferase [Annulohypoxylon maeteangense]|uniref:S-adenosyl-L-methionine-dependent methyltransferase n=1 Tax=Annulohypoxylon maeteangense TaxID=1927788 RepID=UPI002008D00C|nr:S-adenosyl-L-methionine-dependent methyltransferase [Annulohypoxylon maeteangense]KAI0885946.1 S-adenosyl-L-methionine-dependent methyltransferase [Annulohypoxylon maeteangense]